MNKRFQDFRLAGFRCFFLLFGGFRLKTLNARRILYTIWAGDTDNIKCQFLNTLRLRKWMAQNLQFRYFSFRNATNDIRSFPRRSSIWKMFKTNKFIYSSLLSTPSSTRFYLFFSSLDGWPILIFCRYISFLCHELQNCFQWRSTLNKYILFSEWNQQNEQTWGFYSGV